MLANWRKKNRVMMVASILIIAMLGLVGCGGGAGNAGNNAGNDSNPAGGTDQKTVTWRLQSIYSPNTMQDVMGIMIKEELEKATNGRLKIEIYPPGGLAPVNDTVTMLSQGAYDMAVTFGNTFAGVIPEGDLEAGLPFAWQSADEVYDAMENRGLGDLIQEAYDELGINWYWMAHEPNYNALTTFPVKSVNDFKGKKIRALGVWGTYYDKLGAATVALPGPEVYQALQLGTIDGAHYGWSSLEDNKLDEVVDYNVKPTAAFISMAILINQKSLDELPADLRAIVETATKSATMGPISNWHVVATKNAVRTSEQRGTITPQMLSDEDVKVMRKAAFEVWDELAKKSDRMAKGIEILKQQSKDYGRSLE